MEEINKLKKGLELTESLLKFEQDRNKLLVSENRKLTKQLALCGVSKSFASGVKAQITHCIKGHEFEIGEFVTILYLHEDDLWLAKSLERSGQEWYINEEEANVC